MDFSKILETYEKVMHLKIFIDDQDNDLKNIYLEAAKKHNKKLEENNPYLNAGFDLYTPRQDEDDIEEYEGRIACYGASWEEYGPNNKIDFKLQCSARMYTDNQKIYNTGYYMYPRSSLSKTNLRLANSVGIIDSGYRGHIMGMFDVVNIYELEENQSREADCFIEKYDRLVQICAPGLVPVFIEIVDTLEKLGEETERGTGGFGSTGR